MSKIIIGTLRPPLATNATAGIIKGGEDITIGTDGEPVVNTDYDTVDVNTDTNIQNIVKGMKFKSILGNIVSALMGLNGDVSKLNSDFKKYKVLLSMRSIAEEAEYTLSESYQNYTFLEVVFKPTMAGYGSKPVGTQTMYYRSCDILPSAVLDPNTSANRIFYCVDNTTYATDQAVTAFLRFKDNTHIYVDWLRVGNSYNGLMVEIRGFA